MANGKINCEALPIVLKEGELNGTDDTRRDFTRTGFFG